MCCIVTVQGTKADTLQMWVRAVFLFICIQCVPFHLQVLLVYVTLELRQKK